MNSPILMEFSEVERKALQWLAAGVRMVLIVDPDHRMVHVYRANGRTWVLGDPDVLDANDVVPGWRLEIRRLFE